MDESKEQQINGCNEGKATVIHAYPNDLNKMSLCNKSIGYCQKKDKI
jgi:hypothetical protein